jgi:hypothetical protein
MKSQRVRVTVELTFHPWIQDEDTLAYFTREAVQRFKLPELLEIKEVSRETLEPLQVRKEDNHG